MPKQIDLVVKESLEELGKLQSQQKNAALRSRIQMLILIKKNVYNYQTELSDALQYGLRTILNWMNKYRAGGLAELLSYKRGGNRPAAISGKAYTDLKALLHNPKNGISSYGELQSFLAKQGVEIHYQALYKFVAHHFHPKLKVGRKSNVKKDDTAVAVFKNAT